LKLSLPVLRPATRTVTDVRVILSFVIFSLARYSLRRERPPAREPEAGEVGAVARALPAHCHVDRSGRAGDFQVSGRPGCHFGNGAYASRGELVSVSTPAQWRSASSERG